MKLHLLIQSVLLCCRTFRQSFLQWPCSQQLMQVSVLLGFWWIWRDCWRGCQMDCWMVLKFCFCRDRPRIAILETGIPKLKTGCFINHGWGWLCKTDGCFCFPFSDCPLFSLSNFFVRRQNHLPWGLVCIPAL